MQPHRSSGVLLHPTSLPSGRLGEDAYRFVDWLAAAGQSWWALLPLGPPDEHGSPYAAASAFAASPALLAEPDAPVSEAELEAFAERNAYWLASWTSYAGADAVADQVRFEREWTALREYARGRGVGTIGDVPIYVAPGGADLRAWPQLFRPGDVAGAPPDELNADGQHWGNPLYDWDAVRADGFRWWIERFRRTFALVELARIDHFRGFAAYWAIPEGEDARAGRWQAGPGSELFRAVEAELGPLPVIAEDLGVITPDVVALRDELGYPGMAVLHWAFQGNGGNPHRPENHRANQAVYVGTHDTDTAAGWWESLTAAQRAATGLDPREPHWGLIELALASPARLAIVPAQDLLGLGSEARMNRPGVEEGNWRWRLEPGALTDGLAARLREATGRNGRVATPGATRP